MIIFITGFMGAGKTTHGKKLAKIFNINFFDTDNFIENLEKMSIPRIFEFYGEDYFRQREHDALHQLVSENQDAVISTGGGTPCFFNNMKFMNEKGITVFLKLNTKTIIHRLEHSKKERPLVNLYDKDNTKKKLLYLYNKRLPFYEQSKITIDASGLTNKKLHQLYYKIIKVYTTL